MDFGLTNKAKGNDLGIMLSHWKLVCTRLLMEFRLSLRISVFLICFS